jgi:Peptidase C13 family
MNEPSPHQQVPPSPVNTPEQPDELRPDSQPPALPPVAVSADGPSSLSSWQWVLQGLRASVLLAPRIGSARPSALQVLCVFLFVVIAELLVSRMEVAGPAFFHPQSWLLYWIPSAAALWLAWWAMGDQAKGGRLAAWFVLSLPAYLPATLLAYLPGIYAAHATPALWWEESYGPMLVYLLLLVWGIALAARLIAHFVSSIWRVAVFVIVAMALAIGATWQLPHQFWHPDYANAETAAEPEKPELQLSQETFEIQQKVWQETVDDLRDSRPGVGEVYGLVFAPYAREDVFLRESTLVAKVLADRFDARGRVLHLVNHATTTDSHPWATPLNLQRAVQALAARMDLERDVLVVYLTSHGGSDFKLAADHWPLVTQPLTPQLLREALDQAGIVNRVIMVSACYSGGWVEPLASDHTLVLTAADATHTSYGCGKLSELTFFGRALFDEQLQNTHSFEQAFANAVPIIKAREIEAGKADGFSNPQISVGAETAPVLRALEKRLDGVKDASGGDPPPPVTSGASGARP